MGQFSWCTSDTRKSIPCTIEGYKGAPEVVYLLNPFGEAFVEKDYHGYGEFGGRDAFELVAEWNRDCLPLDKLGIHWSDKERLNDFVAGLADDYMAKKYGFDWKRLVGIDIAGTPENHVMLKYPIKIVENLCDYDKAEISPDDPFQGLYFEKYFKGSAEERRAAFERDIEKAFDRLKNARVAYLESSLSDAVAIEYKGVVFDEWTVDKETGGVYGEMCESCVEKFGDKLKDELSTDGGVGACSVKGCDTVGLDDNVEMFYVDFKPELIVPLTKEMLQARMFELLVDEMFEDIKGQLERKENTTSYGEPQAFAEFENGRTIEVVLEQEGLADEEQYYSLRLQCNEAEFDNDDYKATVGVIDTYCTGKADIEEVRDLIENAVRCNEKFPIAEHSRIDDSVIEDEERADVLNASEKGYDLGFGHFGNGIIVWNRLQEEYGDYKKVAHISANREVKYYDKNLPESLRQKIEDYAAKGTPTISATQDQQVFHVPPKKDSLDAQIASSVVSNGENKSEQLKEKAIRGDR